MPEVQIDINDVASIGVIRDSPAHELPPEAWTIAENVRFEDDSIVQLLGYTQIFGTPLFAPYFSQFVSAPGTPWWLYAGLNKIAAFDGTTHFDVTRSTDGATYNAVGAAQWQGTNIGGIPILNDATDVPQYWPLTTTGTFAGLTKMANLPNWPSTLRCDVIRAFGSLMIAMSLTDSSGGPTVLKPYDVRWSHPADPGTVPPTWDITDPTHNAGQVSLSDVDSGQIMDGMGLQGKFYVYKENSVWRFRNVGGQYIFDEDPFLENIGLLTGRCVAVTGDGQRHFFVAQDNLYTHDGNSAKPLLDKRTRRYLFNNVDVGNFGNSFVFINPIRREGWFCYPQVGSTFPDRAIIVNYDTFASTEVGGVDWQAAAIGTIQTSDSSTWSTVAGTWASQTTPWSFANRRKLVLCKPTVTRLEELDLGVTRDGTPFTGLIQRTSLGLVGRKRSGDWITDFEVRKMCHRIWPKMSGSPVQIRLGGQDVPNGPVRWSPYTTFDPNTQKYADITAEGAALCVEISGANGWKLDGYKLDLITLGRF